MIWWGSRVVRQRSAKPFTRVQFSPPSPIKYYYAKRFSQKIYLGGVMKQLPKIFINITIMMTNFYKSKNLFYYIPLI